jgi:hypothetical protein
MRLGLYLHSKRSVWHTVSEDSEAIASAFPADCLHLSHFYSLRVAQVLHPFEGTGFPAYSQILLRLALLTLGPFLTLYLELIPLRITPEHPPSLKGTDYIISPHHQGEPDV